MFKFQAKLIKVTFFLSTLIGLGLVPAEIASSQSTIFNFQTSVGVNCYFTNIVGGSLGLSNDTKTFSSSLTGGSAGTAKLVCNSNANIRVDTPVQLLGPSLTTPTSNSTVVINGNSCSPGNSSNPKTFSQTIASPSGPTSYSLNGWQKKCGNINVNVNMNVTSATKITAGGYTFRVRVTVTP